MSEVKEICIGHIGVDAGLCWIGDPCYILHKDKDSSYDKPPKSIGTDWSNFCDKLHTENGDILEHKSFEFDMGHEGLGVVCSTGYGDGFYPVVAKMIGNRIAEVTVKFIDIENEV